MRETIYYVNGKFLPALEASLPVSDLAIQRGYGIFESLRTYQGRPFYLKDHLIRLEGSAATLELALPWSREELAALVAETLSRNDHPESNIRILVTGGVSENYYTPSSGPGLVIMANPLRHYPEELYRLGVKVATARGERTFPAAKTINYVSGMVAMRAARASDPQVNELLFVDRDGLVTEGFISNVFAFQGGTLVTPGRQILFGVTRQLVLDLAAPRFDLQVRDLPLEELLQADEVFITGSVREIMPVIQVDGTRIGAGAPGPKSKEMMAAFREMIRDWLQTGGEPADAPV